MSSSTSSTTSQSNNIIAACQGRNYGQFVLRAEPLCSMCNGKIRKAGSTECLKCFEKLKQSGSYWTAYWELIARPIRSNEASCRACVYALFGQNSSGIMHNQCYWLMRDNYLLRARNRLAGLPAHEHRAAEAILNMLTRMEDLCYDRCLNGACSRVIKDDDHFGVPQYPYTFPIYRYVLCKRCRGAMDSGTKGEVQEFEEDSDHFFTPQIDYEVNQQSMAQGNPQYTDQLNQHYMYQQYNYYG